MQTKREYRFEPSGVTGNSSIYPGGVEFDCYLCDHEVVVPDWDTEGHCKYAEDCLCKHDGEIE